MSSAGSGRAQRWRTSALIASAAANVAVAVAVIAASLGGGPHGRHGGGPGGGPGGGSDGQRGLDRTQGQALFAALRGNEVLRSGRARMGTAQAGVIAALTADPFVPARLEAALTAQNDLQGALAGRGIAVLSDIVEGLLPEERAAIARRIADRSRP